MNLVVGATGILGGEICRLLAERDASVRAIVRATSDPAKVESLRNLGTEIVMGDLNDRASLAGAVAGATVVISTASATRSRSEDDTIESVDGDGQLSLVDAAMAAGVRQFVYTSFPVIDLDFGLQRAKRAVERRLKDSGLDYTILRPTNFIEPWFSPRLGFDIANGLARIYGSGERPVRWISFRDVARMVPAALDDPRLRDATVEFGGPEALSPLDVVGIFEEQSGREFTVEHVPEEALEAALETAPDSLAEAYAALMLALARARLVPAAPLTGLRSVRDHAGDLTAAVHA
ncbi:MAG TPA: SDR family oxidoreductase [Solirubrobacteraceae bacterium]|nr:SDR family oxidoreductase [Solirubrobacteraceae bacterium]